MCPLALPLSCWLLPALPVIPLQETGLFRGKQTYVFARRYSDGILTTSRDINTKDLTPVSSLFEAAQAFAISTIVFFAASCVHIAQFMGVELQDIGRGWLPLVGWDGVGGDLRLDAAGCGAQGHRRGRILLDVPFERRRLLPL